MTREEFIHGLNILAERMTGFDGEDRASERQQC